MKGSEIIAQYLVQQNVPYVFGICGHGNVGMLDALHDVRDKVQLVSPRHEQCAGHMADAYFRVRHAPVATLTSTGPGSANMVMSLATALADSSAFLAITSNVPTSQMNRAPFQELYAHNQADFPSVLRPVVKRSFQPTRVDMLPLALRQAFDTMVTGRPGPVNLDIPYNVYQEEDAGAVLPPLSHVLGAHRPAASEADLAKITALLKAARRPVFFIGHGVTLAEAGPALTALSQRLGVPVITSPNGMGCVPADDVQTLGFIGRNGAYPANQAGRHADLVITVGTRFDDRSSSSWHPGYSWNFPKTQLVHVDIDPQELGRNYPPTVGVVADCKVFCEQLLAAIDGAGIQAATFGDWRAQVAGWQQEWEAFVRPAFSQITTPIRPEYVVGTLQKVLPDDVILALDSGVHHNWFMQFWKPRRPQSMLNSWGYSSMGFGVCGVLGRAARGARPALRGGGRRRRLHDGALRAVHCGRVPAAVRLDRLEQLRLGRDPRHPARHVRRPRDRHRVLQGQAGPRRRALQPRFRSLGARLRRRRRDRHAQRGPRRRRGAGGAQPPPVRDRPARRR